MSVSLETPTQDNSIECTESSAVSSLCFPCASVILSEAVVSSKQLMTPPAMGEEMVEGEETNIEEARDCCDSKIRMDILVNSISNGGKADTSLRVHCIEDGFYFTLQCYDGFSRADSQLFTWRQIAQLLIATDPDMFGVLDEPLHQVFPESLKHLGYYIPNWQE